MLHILIFTMSGFIGFFEEVNGEISLSTMDLICVTLVFEKFDQSVKLCIPPNTKVRDLPKFLGVDNWMAVDLKESPLFSYETFSLRPEQNLMHFGIYFADWTTWSVD